VFDGAREFVPGFVGVHAGAAIQVSDFVGGVSSGRSTSA
jgi:hypothetical protein